MLWHYIDVWNWVGGNWLLAHKSFKYLEPHQATNEFETSLFNMSGVSLARWFAFDKGQWVSVEQRRQGF